MFSVSGTIFASSLTRAMGTLSARATSRMAFFGLERAERADLSNVAFAVFLLRIVDHHLPSIAAEVDVDIWRFGSAGVQKAFEQQVVFQRTNIAETQQDTPRSLRKPNLSLHREFRCGARIPRSPTRSESSLRSPLIR
jgi:hypothetical protein